MRENRSLGFPTISDTNWAVQSQKKIRIFKCLVEVEEELYYPRSENKGLCFRIGKNLFFSCRGSHYFQLFACQLMFSFFHNCVYFEQSIEMFDSLSRILCIQIYNTKRCHQNHRIVFRDLKYMNIQ